MLKRIIASTVMATATHTMRPSRSQRPRKEEVAGGEACALISPTPRPSSLVPSVTTPLYSTTVSRALRQPLRSRRSRTNFGECPECELRDNGVLRSSHQAPVGGIMLTRERDDPLREVGRKGGRKDEFEPVRASRRILRCPQRGQPPARRDVRWPWPSTGEQGGAGYGGVGSLSGRASKGRRPGG